MIGSARDIICTTFRALLRVGASFFDFGQIRLKLLVKDGELRKISISIIIWNNFLKRNCWLAEICTVWYDRKPSKDFDNFHSANANELRYVRIILLIFVRDFRFSGAFRNLPCNLLLFFFHLSTSDRLNICYVHRIVSMMLERPVLVLFSLNLHSVQWSFSILLNYY